MGFVIGLLVIAALLYLWSRAESRSYGGPKSRYKPPGHWSRGGRGGRCCGRG